MRARVSHLSSPQKYQQGNRLTIHANSVLRNSQAQLRMSTTNAAEDRAPKAVPPSTKIQIVSPTDFVTKQRLNRPVSPHLGIYSWEIMICGALHRNTGILLSGSLYLFGLSYLALPYLGLPFGSAELASWFGNLPVVVRVAMKWIYGFALSFHITHGMRHLIWDTGAMFGNSLVKRTGVAALIVGALGATGLCFM